MEDLRPIEPQESKRITLQDYRNYNRVYTTRRLSTVTQCGHKIDVDNGPKNDCVYCWLSWFNNNAERVTIWTNVIANGGKAGLIAEFGKKQVKWFDRYLSAVGSLKQQGVL